MVPKSLAAALFSTYRQRILALLLLRPEYRYHLSPTPFRLLKWRIAKYHAGIVFMDIR